MRDARHRFSGVSAAEYIATMPHELRIDAVGLWQIIPAGRWDFGLEGKDLIEFTRASLLGLFAQGAMPVIGSSDGIHIWQLKGGYGETADAMADAILAEWLAAGGSDPDVGGLWFALPHIYNEERHQSERKPDAR